jgi:polyisoprenoid-binding protein YceI
MMSSGRPAICTRAHQALGRSRVGLEYRFSTALRATGHIHLSGRSANRLLTQGVTMSLANLSPGVWAIDPTHTSIGFTVRHMMLSKVRGTFSDFTAEVTIDADPLASSMVAEVQMASIDTGNGDRDQHLRTNDFFDIEHHPTMTLRSTGFEGSGSEFVMHAELTIRGVTKDVDFDLEFSGTGQDPWGNTRAGFTATTTINRKDFGIEWNAPLETGGVLVGDRVQIEIDTQIVRG